MAPAASARPETDKAVGQLQSTVAGNSGNGDNFDAAELAGVAGSAAARGGQLSLLETMAPDLLRGRIMATLPVAVLARLSATSKTLRRIVWGPELADVWASHWAQRWSPRCAAAGGDDGTLAAAFSVRANVEHAWCTAPLSPSATLLAHETSQTVCAVGLDSGGGTGGDGVVAGARLRAATGDTAGLVRLWDVGWAVRDRDRVVGAAAEAPAAREARLGMLRLHGKGHAVRWVALHGRRLFAGLRLLALQTAPPQGVLGAARCAAATTFAVHACAVAPHTGIVCQDRLTLCQHVGAAPLWPVWQGVRRTLLEPPSRGGWCWSTWMIQ